MVHDPSLLVNHLLQESGPSAKICPSGNFLLNGLCVGYESLSYGKSSNKRSCKIKKIGLMQNAKNYLYQHDLIDNWQYISTYLNYLAMRENMR